MDKLYGTIKSDLIDNELETKVPIDPVLEPLISDVPIDLYAAITSRLPDLDITTPITEDEAKTYAPVINRLYTQIVPEKPTILAEERIFVYVPKVSKDNAGIANFSSIQFDIINGKVYIKPSYLAQFLGLEPVLNDLLSGKIPMFDTLEDAENSDLANGAYAFIKI